MSSNLSRDRPAFVPRGVPVKWLISRVFCKVGQVGQKNHIPLIAPTWVCIPNYSVPLDKNINKNNDLSGTEGGTKAGTKVGQAVPPRNRAGRAAL